MQLIQLLPESASEERVELCSCFWARLTDRAKTWSDIMRALTAEQQVGHQAAAASMVLWPEHMPNDAVAAVGAGLELAGCSVGLCCKAYEAESVTAVCQQFASCVLQSAVK